MTAKKSGAKRKAPAKTAAPETAPAKTEVKTETETEETQTDLLSAAKSPVEDVPPQSAEDGDGAKTPADPPVEEQDSADEPEEDTDANGAEADVPAAPAAALGSGGYRNTETGEQRRLAVRRANALIADGVPLERV